MITVPLLKIVYCFSHTMCRWHCALHVRFIICKLVEMFFENTIKWQSCFIHESKVQLEVFLGWTDVTLIYQSIFLEDMNLSTATQTKQRISHMQFKYLIKNSQSGFILDWPSWFGLNYAQMLIPIRLENCGCNSSHYSYINTIKMMDTYPIT